MRRQCLAKDRTECRMVCSHVDRLVINMATHFPQKLSPWKLDSHRLAFATTAREGLWVQMVQAGRITRMVPVVHQIEAEVASQRVEHQEVVAAMVPGLE